MSEKPERHKAEWKLGAAGTVGVHRLLISPVGGTVLYVLGGKRSEPRLALLRGLETDCERAWHHGGS